MAGRSRAATETAGCAGSVLTVFIKGVLTQRRKGRRTTSRVEGRELKRLGNGEARGGRARQSPARRIFRQTHRAAMTAPRGGAQRTAWFTHHAQSGSARCPRARTPQRGIPTNAIATDITAIATDIGANATEVPANAADIDGLAAKRRTCRAEAGRRRKGRKTFGMA